jgi:hypothetical protein
MTQVAHAIEGRLHCSAVYSAAKALAIAASLNTEERDEDTNYSLAGEFTGFEYRAEVKGEFGKVAAFSFGEFVGYF